MLKKYRDVVCILGFALLSIYFVFVLYKGLKPNEFLYLPDQYFSFSYNSNLKNAFFTQQYLNLGVRNAYKIILGFFDSLFFLTAYLFTNNFILVQKVLWFLVSFFSLCISYFGIKKLRNLFEIESYTPEGIIFLLSLWFVFNPFTLVLWQAGVYNLTSALTYSLTPLSLYYWHKAMFEDYNLTHIYYSALTLMLMSFTFWLFPSFLLFLGVYSVVYMFQLRSKSRTLAFIKNSLLLGLIFVLFAAVTLFPVIFEYSYARVGTDDPSALRNFGNLSGGIWYQFLMIFSWGIYNVWFPRNMFSYASYYFSQAYLIGIFLMYSVIFVGFYLHKKFTKKLSVSSIYTISIVSLVSTFLVSLFLAKGSQPPLGWIFLYLYDNVPFFSVFRTSDMRFGYTIIFSLLVLLLLMSKYYKSFTFAVCLLFIIFLQTPYLFNGVALRGENIESKYVDRVTSFSTSQQELLDYLNSQNNNRFGFILNTPGIYSGAYTTEDMSMYIGSDLVAKYSPLPFIYASNSGWINPDVYAALTENDNALLHNEFPLLYILDRRDISCPNCMIAQIPETWSIAFKNNLYTLYESSIYKPLVYASDTEFSFKVLSPVKVKIRLQSIKDFSTVSLLFGHSRYWKAYILPYSGDLDCNNECPSSISVLDINDFVALSSSPLNIENVKFQGYGNSWKISKEDITSTYSERYYKLNNDNSLDVDVVLYLNTQKYFYYSFIVSLVSIIIMSVYVKFGHKLKYVLFK